MLNSHEIDHAQALNFDIQMILDAILDITEEFDKKIWGIWLRQKKIFIDY